MKRDFHIYLSALFLLISFALQASERPNFIVILTDDQQFDALGASGNAIIQTTNLDRLAAEGVFFSNANVVFSLCSPSRAAILSGHYGSTNGVQGLGGALNSGEITIAEYLKAAGYATGMTGKWHLSDTPEALGFDFHVYFNSNGAYYNRKTYDMGDVMYPSQHCDDYCADRAVDFMQEQQAKEERFFLFYCTQTPHVDGNHVWNATEESKAKYVVNEMPVPENYLDDLSGKPNYLKSVRNLSQGQSYGYPDTSVIKSHYRDYYAVISETDAFIGRVLDEVEDLGIEENTYIIYLSDNGWMIGDHGFTSKVLPYEPSTHVPFAVKGPGISPAVNDGIVLNIDLLPTILDFAGLTIPEDAHGKSLRPVLEGELEKVRDYFIYEGLGNYGGTQDNLTMVNDNHRYIVTYEGDDDLLLQTDFVELYDQHNDPWEIDNLIASADQSLLDMYLGHVENFRKQLPGQQAYDDPPEGTENVALNASVEVDSKYNASLAGTNAVDGDRETNDGRWVSDNLGYPHWIEIDFGAMKEISYYRFWTGWNGYNRPANDFTFEVWQEESWVIVDAVFGNASAYYSAVFSPVETEKVRFYTSKGSDEILRLYELEVYGSDLSSDVSFKVQEQANMSAFYDRGSRSISLFYELEQSVVVDISLITIEGKKVFQSLALPRADGWHTERILLQHLPEGIYVCQFSAGKTIESCKIYVNY